MSGLDGKGTKFPHGIDVRGSKLYADGISTGGQNYILDSNDNEIAVLPMYSYIGTSTLAELNAGKPLIVDMPGRTIKVVGYLLKFTGGFITATDIRLQDTNASPVIINTVAIAAATDGAKISSEAVIANVTDGPGLFANLTPGKGVKLVKTGSSAAGGTSILIKILYNII